VEVEDGESPEARVGYVAPESVLYKMVKLEMSEVSLYVQVKVSVGGADVVLLKLVGGGGRTVTEASAEAPRLS
jgi:hypothetical protein